jgi:hypothetical protein
MAIREACDWRQFVGDRDQKRIAAWAASFSLSRMLLEAAGAFPPFTVSAHLRVKSIRSRNHQLIQRPVRCPGHSAAGLRWGQAMGPQQLREFLSVYHEVCLS